MKNDVRIFLVLLCALFVASCGTATPALVPNTGTILPNAKFNVSKGVAFSAEELAVAAVAGGVLYMIYDPLAPNWSIEERPLNVDTYYLSLRAKSFRTGGDGESVQIFKRRALQLQREKGYASYRILDYSEGIESSTPLTHRVAEGTIQLVKAQLPSKP